MSEKLLPCPFCGGEARTFEYDGANQATCGGKHIDCAGTDVVAPVAMWNRRTPAPEGEACPHDAYETDAAGQPVRCVDCGMAIASAAAPVVPVGVRERVLDELDGAWLHGQRRTPWRRDESADAIMAACQPAVSVEMKEQIASIIERAMRDVGLRHKVIELASKDILAALCPTDTRSE